MEKSLTIAFVLSLTCRIRLSASEIPSFTDANPMPFTTVPAPNIRHIQLTISLAPLLIPLKVLLML